MNIREAILREAILKAADHIERNPGEFDFCSYDIPSRPHCGTPGCAIGWIATFRGMSLTKRGDNFDSKQALRIIGAEESEFYSRMNAVSGNTPYKLWHLSAHKCAAALRLYADKYHPAPIAADRQLVPWSQCAWRPAGIRA